MNSPIMRSWTRLESVPRDPSLTQGVQARVADPLWMLTRQWQFAELQGEDAGSPAEVRLSGTADRLTRFLPRLPDGTPGTPLDVGAVPLEALVEAERQPADATPTPAFAARAGLHAVRLLRRAASGSDPTTVKQVEAYVAALTARFPLSPGDPEGTADPVLRLAAGRAPDGQAVYRAYVTGLRKKSPRLPTQPPLKGLKSAWVKKVMLEFLDWYDALTGRDFPDTDAWVPDRVEYQFSVSAPTARGELVLAASEYDTGSLDWSSLDAAPGAVLGARDDDPAAARKPITHIGLAAPVSYRGMPAPRWWELEDAAVAIGDLSAPPEELATLMVVDFALRYSNDFFVVPVPLDLGTVARVDALIVTDTFGERFMVRSVAKVDGNDGGFRLFEQSTPDGADREDAFVLLPVLDDMLEGAPVEDVQMFRDEAANLAWAVESRAFSPEGTVVDRVEAGGALAGAASTGPAAPVGSPRVYDYQIRTDVPANWFPLLPVTEGTGSEVRLLLGDLPPIDGGAAPEPWGRLLEEIRAVRVPLEEVPKDGVRVTRSWQYVRWVDGRQHAWVGRRARPGRGSEASGLRFDIAEPRA